MRQISLVGAVDEEVGDYFPEFLGMLEESPFLKVSQDRMAGINANQQQNGWMVSEWEWQRCSDGFDNLQE